MSLTILPQDCISNLSASTFDYASITVYYPELPQTIQLDASSEGYCQYQVEADEAEWYLLFLSYVPVNPPNPYISQT